MHGEESVLAFLVIALWHLYNVHVAPGRFPLQWTFWTGRIAKDQQIEEHFLEYERQVQGRRGRMRGRETPERGEQRCQIREIHA